MKIINWIRSFFKKSPLPNLGTSVKQFNSLIEELDNTMFYLSQVKDLGLSKDRIAYLEKAHYNLMSFRDELKLEYDRKNNPFEKKRLNLLNKLGE